MQSKLNRYLLVLVGITNKVFGFWKMDKFVAKYRKELEKNPNAGNRLNVDAAPKKKKKNKISNYFKIKQITTRIK